MIIFLVVMCVCACIISIYINLRRCSDARIERRGEERKGEEMREEGRRIQLAYQTLIKYILESIGKKIKIIRCVMKQSTH